MHSVGFTPRPRLRGRPSFYDLIRSSVAIPQRVDVAADSLPVVNPRLHKELDDLIASTVPLPTSPTHQRHRSLPQSTSSISEEVAPLTEHTTPSHTEITMAPVSIASGVADNPRQKLIHGTQKKSEKKPEGAQEAEAEGQYGKLHHSLLEAHCV